MMLSIPRNKTLVLDGGTGETLFRAGMLDDRKTWSALAVTNADYHDLLVQVHRDFIKAGADMITVNNYSLTPGSGFTHVEIPPHADRAAALARKAATEAGKGTLVCGALAPLLESYRPDLVLPHDEGVQLYRSIALAMQSQVDVYLAETMSSYEEAWQALDAVRGLELPLMVSWSLKADGMLRSGETPEAAIRKLMSACEHETTSTQLESQFAADNNGNNNHIAGENMSVKLFAVLFNCCTPEAITIALSRLKADEGLHEELMSRGIHIGAYANKLTDVPDGWTMADSTEAQPLRADLDPREYWELFVDKWIHEMGVTVVGGCCGMYPEHIEHISTQVKGTSAAVEGEREEEL